MPSRPEAQDKNVPAPNRGDPFAGRVLSHYRLDAPLGEGGMGMLYRATDLALGRSVAIKLLARHLTSDENAKVRFLREARAASALDHPHIATIHDVGEQDGEIFIVLALYEGETLKQRLERGRLPLAESLAILRQVALGLEAAHRVGIVHRDIKPANVLLTNEGTVKLLDFGLAKLLSDSQAQMTQDGQAMGTVLYMSPEQLRGESVDERSDLWSFGVLAYEMLSGVSPFRADSNAAIITRILNEQPPSLAAIPGVPQELADLVSRLLRKDPAERPQSATEVLTQLSSPSQTGVGTAIDIGSRPLPSSAIGSPVSRGRSSRAKVAVIAGAVLVVVLGAIFYLQRRSQSGTGKFIVVLPFLNASANADMEFFSDGIAESLIDNLSQIPELRVIARNTAFGYKGKQVDFQKLGHELSVDTVLTGQVQQRGDTLIVHADLVNLADRSQLWGERFSRKLTDLPALEEDVARAISDKLRPRLAADLRQRLRKRPTESSEAYELYLRGRYFSNKRTKEDVNQSIEYFQQAIQFDPKYALAYAGLSDAYAALGWYALAPAKENYARSEEAALKALALDDQQAEAHASLGFVKLAQWEWAAAEQEFKRSIALSPNYATAHNQYGLLLHIFVRRGGEAIAEFDRARQLDPASAIYVLNRAMMSCLMGEYDQGLAQLREASTLKHPNNGFIELIRGECYLRQGMYQQATDELTRAIAINPADPRFSGALGFACARSGQRDRATSILTELMQPARRTDMATAIAGIYVGLDDNDRALEWLEKAYQWRSPNLPRISISIMTKSLRSDPRFKDLLRRLGLPP